MKRAAAASAAAALAEEDVGGEQTSPKRARAAEGQRGAAGGGSAPAMGALAGRNGIGSRADEAVSLHEAFDRLAARHGPQSAVEDELGCAWTYEELRQASARMAAGLLEPLFGAAASLASSRPPVLAVLMRRSCAWVAACLAAARLGAPLLALSADLGSAEEAQRNREALAEHRPRVLVLDAALQGSAAAAAVAGAGAAWEVLDAAELLASSAPETSLPGPEGRSADDALFLVYTGGTTSASKCVAVTHRMALHELEVYPQISPLECSDRVLHQSSAYWGATSLGLFDIAWACGGCLVLAEGGAGPAEVTRAIRRHRITVAGLVPSVLDALEWENCCSLRLVFTWGEALAPATAARWAAKVALLDLLIASEYWLILFADHRAALDGGSAGQRVGFRPVRGAHLTFRAPDSEGAAAIVTGQACPREVAEVAEGEVGELFMAGPMVSAIGYTDPARNVGTFVDLPVGPQGRLVRHFRTRDLARKRPDGSLEYCGRADGFAKVGGKWLDLASVEQQLRGAGCKDAALVWDENAKLRHAAVVLEGATPPARSLAAWVAALHPLLPKDTKLHILRALPQHAITGKVHRGALVKLLATAEAAPRPSALPPAVVRVRRSLAVGLLLAARAGARGAALLPLAWHLAPGLLSKAGGHGGLLAALPCGLAWYSQSWASWYGTLGRCLTPLQLTALPHVALLLMDTPATGLEAFARLVKGPLGTFGAALLVTCRATPWLRALLVAAASRHASRARGGRAWLWAFWLGLPAAAEYWAADQWASAKGASAAADAETAVRALGPLLGGGGAGGAGGAAAAGAAAAALPELTRCAYCWEWAAEGELWRGRFCCAACCGEWQAYQRQTAEDGSSTPPLAATPEPSPREFAAHRRGPRGATWRPVVDEIDFADYEVRLAAARAPPPPSRAWSR